MHNPGDMLEDLDVITGAHFNADLAFLFRGALGNEDFASFQAMVWV
jgi:hypothetical protein